jgi:hypothetical protein
MGCDFLGYGVANDYESDRDSVRRNVRLAVDYGSHRHPGHQTFGHESSDEGTGILKTNRPGSYRRETPVMARSWTGNSFQPVGQLEIVYKRGRKHW